LLLGQQAFLFGAAWDIQWHLQVGRDRPLTPPHVLLLAGIALTGLLALAAVITAITGGAKHSLERLWDDDHSTGECFAPTGVAPGAVIATSWLRRVLRAPVGALLAGVGALLSTVAFPLDDYWHRLYGLDVTLWSPFHVMIVSGMALAALGAVYVFAAAAHGKAAAHAARTRRAAETGTAVALACVAGTLLILLAQALDSEGIARVALPVEGGPRRLLVFPPLLVALTTPWLVAAAAVVGLPGGATVAATALTLMRLGMFAVVPWAVRAAAAWEGQPVRAGGLNSVATPLAFPAWVVAAGLTIDALWWLVRSRRVPLSPALSLLLAGAAAGCFLAWVERPWQWTLPLARAGRGVDLQAAFAASLPLVVACAVVAAAIGVGMGGALRRTRT
jgi:hypothetical protein